MSAEMETQGIKEAKGDPMMPWVPLESNPEVMTKFLHSLGVPKSWGIVDVYGLDPELLVVLPKPVVAIILLYPLTEKIEEPKKVEESPEDDIPPPENSVYHIKQYISNACGTIALIHSVANNLDSIKLEDGFLKKFLSDTSNYSFSKRGLELLKPGEITTLHQACAMEGQTEAPDVNTPVFHHFVSLVHWNGILYELDGRKSKSIEHGPTTPETFLEDAARVCKEYMARDPEEMSFTVMALAKID